MSNARLNRWLFALVVAPLIVGLLGLVYLDARFDAGVSPLPYILVAYGIGVVIGLVFGLVLPYKTVCAAGAIGIALWAFGAVTGAPNVTIWFAAFPGAGVFAATLMPCIYAKDQGHMR
ncbi:MAG TPA: hypothetical protein VIH21_10865 [Dehalococcoidia bacterium]|jgi:hypothetical protein